ncbi:MAG: hypothetical protein A2X64_02175 [Ignavibacteria bacterium GWF2_33_9]|nr:MAG: hypothetical protein A2X64_02175 [Ignavibacteria bacterium GWF2_33_9]
MGKLNNQILKAFFKSSILIIIIISLFACEDRIKEPLRVYTKNLRNYFHFDTTRLDFAKELSLASFPEKFSDFTIVYFDKKSSRLFLEFDNLPNQLYFTIATIESAQEIRLLRSDYPEKIYLGKFKFLSDTFGDFSFLAINSYDSRTKKYLNIFNDYFIFDNSENPDINYCKKFINGKNNVLIVSYSEGAGNYLSFKIYGPSEEKFSQIYEPVSPLENGMIAVDSNYIYTLEGIISSKIYWKNGKVISETLAESPLINFQGNDYLLEISYKNEVFSKFPKFISLNYDADLFIKVKGIVPPDENLLVNYDSEFLSLNFNSFTSKKSGKTYLEFKNQEGISIGKIYLLINPEKGEIQEN